MTKLKLVLLSEILAVEYYIVLMSVKGELGEIQIYCRKIPLHQQKILVVSVLSNSLWLPRN